MSLEEMDMKVLQFQSRKLTELLEQRQRQESELRQRIEQLEKRQTSDEAVLCVVNRYWNQLIEDLRILLQRFEPETSNEYENRNESEAPTSFLALLGQWDREELEEKLAQRVQVSTRAIGKVLQAFDKIVQRNHNVMLALMGDSSDGEDIPSLDAAVRQANIELQNENKSLHLLVTGLHKKHHQMNLKFSEMTDKLATLEISNAELKNMIEGLEYDLSKSKLREEKLDKHLSECLQKLKSYNLTTESEGRPPISAVTNAKDSGSKDLEDFLLPHKKVISKMDQFSVVTEQIKNQCDPNKKRKVDNFSVITVQIKNQCDPNKKRKVDNFSVVTEQIKSQCDPNEKDKVDDFSVITEQVKNQHDLDDFSVSDADDFSVSDVDDLSLSDVDDFSVITEQVKYQHDPNKKCKVDDLSVVPEQVKSQHDPNEKGKVIHFSVVTEKVKNQHDPNKKGKVDDFGGATEQLKKCNPNKKGKVDNFSVITEQIKNQCDPNKHKVDNFSVVAKQIKNQCDICLRQFPRRYNLIRHLKAIHPVTYHTRLAKCKMTENQCRECSKYFLTSHTISRHNKCVHKICSEKNEHQEAPADPNIPQKKKHKCETCNKEFTFKSNYCRHRRKVHKTEPQLRAGFQCSECLSCFPSSATYLGHISEQHSEITIEMENLEFESIDKFQSWKSEIERNSLSSYVVKMNRSNYSLFEGKNISVYGCHRSGIFKSTSKGKRHLKSQGSNKIGFYCPAGIRAETLINGDGSEYVKVTYQSKHIGHNSEVGSLRCTKL